MKRLKDFITEKSWIRLENQSSTTGDMRASH